MCILGEKHLFVCFFNPHLRICSLILEREEEGWGESERAGERARATELQHLVVSCMPLDWESNLQCNYVP